MALVCLEAPKNAAHLFFECDFAKKLWVIFSWCCISPREVHNRLDLTLLICPPDNVTWFNLVRLCPDQKVLDPVGIFNGTKSFFFIDVYTYFAWVANPAEIKLDYALLEPGKTRYTDPVTKLVYTNLLEQMLDALFFAMRRVGYPNTRIFIAETGWPNGCDVDQIGGNIYNAATYNRNVVKWLTRKPARGTPLKPTVVFPSFIFALYNENQKTGPGTERHFGLLYPNGTSIYEIDLSGKTEEYKKALPAPTNNEPYKGPIWCMAARGVNVTALAGALSYACGQGNGTCDPIQSGGKCFRPNVLRWHASYAFSSYWAQFKKAGGSCYFNGLAVQTTENPMVGRIAALALGRLHVYIICLENEHFGGLGPVRVPITHNRKSTVPDNNHVMHKLNTVNGAVGGEVGLHFAL
ncbi:Glycoside hydrolase, catalytic domain-containing protein [Artemisia annua]|uniref:Glycoside hydrolase, catalytic domain-containing protein n=1 Tax=Artemisia annua TaxID=35608 RepID=A0A2U1LY96_ARTAN|nr:Glycoside hydrolase, catalytic domain-containing protein [Artemisia annua]